VTPATLKDPATNDPFSTLCALGLLQTYVRAHSPEAICIQMKHNKVHEGRGFRFCTLSNDPWVLRKYAEYREFADAELELELLEVYDDIPPHIHKNSGGPLIRLRPEDSSIREPEIVVTLTQGVGHGLRQFSTSLRPGCPLFVPAGTTHSLRYVGDIRRPVYLVSASTPPIVNDTKYV
jgi:hypothetical protein